MDQHLERLDGLQPDVRKPALAAMKEATAAGLGIMVTDGLRTYARQAELYAQGRTTPGKIVTNAEPGESYHNFGYAFDFVVVQGDKAIWDNQHPQWQRFVKIAKGQGFEWGGDWSGFRDYPHFQLIGSVSLSSLQAKYPQGYHGGGAPAMTGSAAPCTNWSPKDSLPVARCDRDGGKKLVSRIQAQLDIEADGYFGPSTDKAVREYQAVHDESGKTVARGKGLVVDGVVGPKTWDALIGKAP